MNTIKTISLVTTLAVSSAFAMEEAFEIDQNLGGFQKARAEQAGAGALDAQELDKLKTDIAQILIEAGYEPLYISNRDKTKTNIRFPLNENCTFDYLGHDFEFRINEENLSKKGYLIDGWLMCQRKIFNKGNKHNNAMKDDPMPVELSKENYDKDQILDVSNVNGREAYINWPKDKSCRIQYLSRFLIISGEYFKNPIPFDYYRVRGWFSLPVTE